MATLDVNPETGLSDKEAAARVAQAHPEREDSSFFKFAANAFARPVIYLLLITAAVSALFGGLYEALLILAAIAVNVVFSAGFKHRGAKSLENSINASVTNAIVLRNGAKMKLATDELVVGDVVTIKPGRVVPADLRLISSEDLIIDESALTGEAEVKKDCNASIPHDVALSQRCNCAFEGTVVLRGRGDGVVVATGMSTEMSLLTLPLDVPKRNTAPVFSRLRELSKMISIIVSMVCVMLFVAGVVRGRPFITMALLSLSLAVAIIPESVFTAALTALARGARKLNRHGFSPKTMAAVENLGEVTVLCTDIPKLGIAATYTNGRIKTPQEEDTAPFLDGLLLCQLKDKSLFSFASHKCDAKKVMADFPKIGEASGEVSTTLHRAGNTTISYTGGSPEEIVARSEFIWEFGRIRTITESDREDIRNAAEALGDESYTLTALGLRSGDDVPCDTGLVFLGIAASRAENSEATTPDTVRLGRMGVKTYLLTESDAEKAKLGAAALSLPCENILSGRDIRTMNDRTLHDCIADTFVFTGLSAQDKVRIIHALRARGETVAMIGESLADSPALDAADVGLSDIHAKDAAKDASDVIYNGELSAGGAILLGKEIRSSIRKVMTYLVAANIGELVCVFISIVLGLASPISPFQILVLNLITDTLPAILLASSGGIAKKRELAFAYVWGTALGVCAIMLQNTFTSELGTAALVSWATCALLVFGELLMAVIIHFIGRNKKCKLK